MNRYLASAIAITAISQSALAQPLASDEPGPPRYNPCRASTDSKIAPLDSIGRALESLAEKAALYLQEFGEELPDWSSSLALDGLVRIANVAAACRDLQVDFTIGDDGDPSMILDLNGKTVTCRLAEGWTAFGYGVGPFVRFGDLDEGVAWLLNSNNSLG